MCPIFFASDFRYQFACRVHALGCMILCILHISLQSALVSLFFSVCLFSSLVIFCIPLFALRTTNGTLCSCVTAYLHLTLSCVYVLERCDMHCGWSGKERREVLTTAEKHLVNYYRLTENLLAVIVVIDYVIYNKANVPNILLFQLLAVLWGISAFLFFLM